MTRHLIALALTLLLAAPVGAEHTSISWTSYPLDQTPVLATQAQLGMAIVMATLKLTEWPKPLTCEQRMEAAMKAVSPYLVGPVDQAKRQGWEAVINQWYNTARKCWKEKP